MMGDVQYRMVYSYMDGCSALGCDGWDGYFELVLAVLCASKVLGILSSFAEMALKEFAACTLLSTHPTGDLRPMI